MNAGDWWTRSWNVVRGCSPVGAGCDRCWAARMAARFSGATTKYPDGVHALEGCDPEPFYGFAERGSGGPRWTGRVELVESMLEAPLHWRKPSVIAVSLMGDLFHENLPDEARDRILAVMALCPQHRFITLTKRWQRQAEYFQHALDGQGAGRVAEAIISLRRSQGHDDTIKPLPHGRPGAAWWPLANLIIGTSAWNQDSADEACKWLLQTPAAKRLLCLEPLIAPVRLTGRHTYCPTHDFDSGWCTGPCPDRRHLDWVIVGGETGPGARPVHPEWVRQIRDRCQAAGVPFWFKQWGEHREVPRERSIFLAPRMVMRGDILVTPDGRRSAFTSKLITNELEGEGIPMRHVGRKAAGRLLDGRTWDQRPEVSR